MASKFAAQVSRNNKSVREARANALSGFVKFEFEAKINEIKKRKFTIQAHLDKVTDLGPNSTQSLRPTEESFSASQWVTQVVQTNQALKDIDLELEVAEAAYAEWFGTEVPLDAEQGE